MAELMTMTTITINKSQHGSLSCGEDALIEFDDGESYVIEACEERVYLFLAKNGVVITVMLHDKPVEGFHPNDRIQLTMIDKKKIKASYFITVLEALAIAEGLTRASVIAIEKDIPTS